VEDDSKRQRFSFEDRSEASYKVRSEEGRMNKVVKVLFIGNSMPEILGKQKLGMFHKSKESSGDNASDISILTPNPLQLYQVAIII
jgi:hypothetical protein